MAKLELFYATNRRHEGGTRFRPKTYGTAFSKDGIENLRFGRVAVQSDDAKVAELLRRERTPIGPGAGEELSGYLAKCAAADTANHRLPREPARRHRSGR